MEAALLDQSGAGRRKEPIRGRGFAAEACEPELGCLLMPTSQGPALIPEKWKACDEAGVEWR